eukprot:2401029-Rhodomonas_salina.1
MVGGGPWYACYLPTHRDTLSTYAVCYIRRTATCLRMCHAMSGTGLAYGAAICYAMCGTDLAYAATICYQEGSSGLT